MKRGLYIAVLIAAVCALAVAQTATPQAPLSGAGRQYNPAAETTITGTVQQMVHTRAGEHVIVNTPQGQYNVALGPAAYVNQQNLNLTPGAPISITGAPTNIGGQQFFVARDVEQNGRTVAFRNAQGVPAWTGAGMGQGMMGRMRSSNVYNPATETTLSGTVQQVNHYMCGPFAGTLATINTSQGIIDAQLAPYEYMQQQNIMLRPGQRVDVTGSQINIDGSELLLARSITANGRTVALRNAQGTPMWAGMMRGRAMPATDESAPAPAPQYEQQPPYQPPQ